MFPIYFTQTNPKPKILSLVQIVHRTGKKKKRKFREKEETSNCLLREVSERRMLRITHRRITRMFITHHRRRRRWWRRRRMFADRFVLMIHQNSLQIFQIFLKFTMQKGKSIYIEREKEKEKDWDQKGRVFSFLGEQWFW